jgi:PAS domain S-box-containing protein
MNSRLSDSEDRASQLELENSRLRNEIERLAGLFTQDESDVAASLADTERRSRWRAPQLLPILDNLPALIGYWDNDLRNRFANQAYAKWFSLTPAQLKGMHIRDVIGEEHYQLNLPHIERVLRGEAQKFERAVATADGNEVKHFHAEYIPNIVNGEVLGFFGQIIDITAIREAEENSALLEFALNQGQEAFFMVEESGRIFHTNKVACVSYGYEQTELTGRYISDVDPDVTAEMWPEVWRQHKSQGTATFEARHKMKGGAMFPVEVTAIYFEYVGKPYVLGWVRNISERRLAKNTSLLQSEILMHVHEGVQLTRLADKSIVYTTPVFDRMFGYAENELIGRPASVLNPSSANASRQTEDQINLAIDESGYWQGEMGNVRKDGGTFWCWVKISSFEHHEFGKVWVAVYEDITQRKQIEMDLHREKLTMHRDSLVREVHHRVKNNLQGITGVLRMFAASHPELAQPLGEAISQVQSIAVIHGLQGQTGRNTVFLCEMTSAIAASIESLWKKPVSVDIPLNWRRRHVVESEAVPMALVVNELISNAIKHGGGKAGINLRHETGRDCVIVSIRNSGSIPSGFGLNNPDLSGTGLRLVASLLPQNGVKLCWSQEGADVVTTLEVCVPVITLTDEISADVA